MSFNMFGTTTAGDTAAKTEPRISESSNERCRITGPNNANPMISNVAGRKHIKIAGLPTFFNASKSRFNPARIRMMINATLRIDAEASNIEASINLKQYGPNKIPHSIKPNNGGNLIFLNKSPSNNPQSKSKAKLNNINTLSSRQTKKLIPCMIKNIAEVISCNSGLEFLPGRHHFR